MQMLRRNVVFHEAEANTIISQRKAIAWREQKEHWICIDYGDADTIELKKNWGTQNEDKYVHRTINVEQKRPNKVKQKKTPYAEKEAEKYM